MPNSGIEIFEAVKSRHLAPFDGSLRVASNPTVPPDDYSLGKKAAKEELASCVAQLREQQRMLYADNKWAVLLVFQAMDAAGKDGTIRHVMSGINPAGCQVFSFKQPSTEELEHDFLWRTSKKLPERGRVGVFNRSHYEEVLVVRVHPEYLKSQNLPHIPDLNHLWAERLASIEQHERHLARNGTVVLKFWLNVSREEQRRRFLSRLEEPDKNWKFSTSDVRERGHWDEYMAAYEEAINTTSKPWAPWYAIPADDKRYMRLAVARIVLASIETLNLGYPEVDNKTRDRFAEMRQLLEDEQ
ncbi:MAG: polyphosphate kinase 2 family protein [Gammaproteobacteria bacterium]|nr:polyphosphate kinase 2 family protein [Gammaproteobacteria bacterium]